MDGGYVVRGQKIWTSRALYSDLMLLLARTTPLDQVEKKTEGLSTFIVDMKQAIADGKMTIRPIKTLMNHATTEIFFDGVEVPADALVGEEGKGFRYILDGMNAERILIAAECIGDGHWFVEKAAAYASERVVFGRPIGQNQGVQFPIARAHAAIEAADLMRYKAAWLFEQGQPCGAEANLAKLLGSEASWAAGERVPRHPRRLRLRGGVRHRAEVPRDAALLRRAPVLEQPDPRRLPRASTCSRIAGRLVGTAQRRSVTGSFREVVEESSRCRTTPFPLFIIGSRDVLGRGLGRRVREFPPARSSSSRTRPGRDTRVASARSRAPPDGPLDRLRRRAARLNARSEPRARRVKPRPMKTIRERRSSSGHASRCSGGWTTCWTPLTSSGPSPPTFSSPFTRRMSSPRACSSIVSQIPNAPQSSSSSR